METSDMETVRMSLDPIPSEVSALRALLRARQAAPGPINIVARRAAMDAFGDLTPLPAGVSQSEETLNGVPGQTLSPRDSARAARILYLHGGGYVIGSSRSHRGLAAQLALAAGMATTVLDYRLAPEHPAPAAVEDAVAAYEALVAAGVSPERIVIAGDSAGGGLALAMTHALKGQGRPLPAGLFCMSPWADLAQTGPSYDTAASVDPMLTKDNLDAFAAHYRAGLAPDNPIISPVHGDFAGFPPLLIHAGTHEILLSDAHAVAAKAALADVETTLVSAAQMIHVFHAFFPMLTPARTALAQAGRWIRARIDGAQPTPSNSTEEM
jgi:monoterpene epsilon-lactone hydrolase